MTKKTLLFACILLTGCVRAPDVQLTSVKVMGVGLSGATLMAELRIENPNPFRIEADSIAVQLQGSEESNGTHWSSLMSETHAEQYILAKHSITTIKLPIDFTYAGLALPLRSLFSNGSFTYRLSGAVYVRKPLPKRVDFAKQGTLTLGSNQ